MDAPTIEDTSPAGSDEATGAAQAHVATAPLETGQTGPGLIEEELLVEEVSIDGMCGVY